MSLSQDSSFAETDFSAFKRKVKLAYGLDLEAYKRPQMERRLRANMDKCGADSFTQYFSFMQKDQLLADEFFDRLTINVSELFRNPEQFDTLRTMIFPELLKKSPSLSLWSAGCSYGAEPYSLAVLLDEVAPAGKHNILASDIDEKMLARGKSGIFQEAEMRSVSRPRLLKYFQKTEDGFEAKDQLKKMIKFQKHNLLESRFPTGVDMILCRNVVIYFTDETKTTLYKKFFASLRPGGYLFVGGTERIGNHNEIGFENTVQYFYRKPIGN